MKQGKAASTSSSTHRSLTRDVTEQLFKDFLKVMRVRDGNPEVDLSHTPGRIARMYVDELLIGYDDAALTDLKARFTVFNVAQQHEMVVIKGTWFMSLCAHHMLPFFGTVAFGYIPNKKVVGLSKFPRIVKHFAARLQTQENLTTMLAEFVQEMAQPQALIVQTKAMHLCCAGRGVHQPTVEMVTSAIRPVEMPVGVKEEFYRLIGS